MNLTLLCNQSKQTISQGLKIPFLLLKTWFSGVFLDLCMKNMGGNNKPLFKNRNNEAKKNRTDTF